MHSRFVRSLVAVALAAGSFLAAVSPAMADKVTLKDGNTVEGTIVRETDAFIQIKVKTGGIETARIIQKSEIAKVERDTPPAAAEPKTDPKPAEGAKDEAGKADGAKAETPAPPADAKADAEKARGDKAAARAKQLDAGTSRVAIMNFGAPESWHGEIEDTIGIQVNVAAWRAAVPLLEKDHVNVVVVRVHSGGGLGLEVGKFHSLFQNTYKKKFRTVAWIESGISAAAMSPYVIEEMYFMSNGSLGACTGWYGALKNVEGLGLQEMLHQMEEASAMGGRSPAIMRSMQIQVPLSATIDPNTGEVTWFNDTGGEYLLNPVGQIYTMKADDAMKFKFARGIADTKEELAKAMGLNEVVWAGEEATRFIDDNMRATDRTEKRWQLKYREFQMYFGLAQQSQDEKQRGAFVGKALTALREMRSMFSTNPNFGLLNGVDDGFFTENEEALKKLLRKDR